MTNHNDNTEWKEEPEYYGVLSDAKEVFSHVSEEDNHEKMEELSSGQSGTNQRSES